MARAAIGIREKAGVRYLHFGSDWVQGAMRIQRPYALELPYTREMMAGLLLRDPPWPGEALLVGLGAGSLVKFIYHQLPNTRSTVIEIDPQVEQVARRHFKVPEDPLRLRVVIDDGAQYMLRGGRLFDYILVDGFDSHARAGVLETLPFYLACRSRLSTVGLLAVNLLGRERGLLASSERIQQAFDGRVLFFPSDDHGNTIALAAAGDPIDVRVEDLLERAQRWRQEGGLNVVSTVSKLQRAGHLHGDRLQI